MLSHFENKNKEANEKSTLLEQHKHVDMSLALTNQISSQMESHKLLDDGLQYWKKLPKEVVSKILSYIYYKEEKIRIDELGKKSSTGLIALRLVAKDLNLWVENSADGQIARKAMTLEANFISKKLNQIDYKNYQFGETTSLTTGGGLTIGGLTFCGIGLSAHLGWYSLLLCVPGWIAGGYLGFCGATPIAEGISFAVRHGLFENKKHVEKCNENANAARAELKEPETGVRCNPNVK